MPDVIDYFDRCIISPSARSRFTPSIRCVMRHLCIAVYVPVFPTPALFFFFQRCVFRTPTCPFAVTLFLIRSSAVATSHKWRERRAVGRLINGRIREKLGNAFFQKFNLEPLCVFVSAFFYYSYVKFNLVIKEEK